VQQTEYDIIIIGGGPAGSICAIFLKKNNPSLNIAIIDKDIFPREKACGDGLSPGAVKIIQEAGLGHLFFDRLPINNFCLSLHGKQKINYNLKNLPGAGSEGYVYPRKLLDHELIKHAVALGVTFLDGCSLISMEEEKDFYSWLTCHHLAQTIKLGTRLVIGADGSNSVIRKYLKIPFNKDYHTGVALRGYCTLQDNQPPSLSIDILKNKGSAYGWVFPVSSNRANIGVGIDLSIYKKQRLNIHSLFKQYTETKKQEIKLTLDENSLSGFTLPYGSKLPPLFSGNKALIGDAASMINPLTGEGIFYAMKAGQMLASHLAGALHSPEHTSRALAAFSISYKNSFQEHFRLNLLLKKILASPFAGILFKRMANREKILDKAMNVIMGNGHQLYNSSIKMRLLKKITGTA
jgi:geranylgeranyl reductase family protein